MSHETKYFIPRKKKKSRIQNSRSARISAIENAAKVTSTRRNVLLNILSFCNLANPKRWEYRWELGRRYFLYVRRKWNTNAALFATVTHRKFIHFVLGKFHTEYRFHLHYRSDSWYNLISSRLYPRWTDGNRTSMNDLFSNHFRNKLCLKTSERN